MPEKGITNRMKRIGRILPALLLALLLLAGALTEGLQAVEWNAVPTGSAQAESLSSGGPEDGSGPAGARLTARSK